MIHTSIREGNNRLLARRGRPQCTVAVTISPLEAKYRCGGGVGTDTRCVARNQAVANDTPMAVLGKRASFDSPEGCIVRSRIDTSS